MAFADDLLQFCHTGKSVFSSSGSISSIIRKHFHILVLSQRYYNVFKAAPVIAYRRSSNLRGFLVRVKLRNPTQHNQPRGSYHVEKTVSLVNTYLTEKLHTHSTLQAKPDLSLIKSTVTPKRHLYDTMQPLLQTIHR